MAAAPEPNPQGDSTPREHSIPGVSSTPQPIPGPRKNLTPRGAAARVPNSTESGAHQLRDRGKRGIQRGWVASAGLREIGPSATAAADLCGNRTN